MALNVEDHVLIISNPDAFLAKHKEKLGNPGDYHVDHQGRHKPLVVKHACGTPSFQVEEDGSIAPFEPPKADPNAAPTVLIPKGGPGSATSASVVG